MPFNNGFNCGILSQYMATGIATWFTQNTYFNGMFASINDYCRIDTPTSEMTAVSIYAGDNTLSKKTGWECGEIIIDVTFSMSQMREFRSAEINKVMSTIKGQILENPTFLLSYLGDNWVAGLQLLTSFQTVKMSDIRNQIKQARGETTFTLKLGYEISIYLNQKAFYDYGATYYSNGNIIFQPNTGFDLTVNGVITDFNLLDIGSITFLKKQ